MNSFVVDTMAFILRLENRKMPVHIKKIFIEAENRSAFLKIPAIVFAELGYLSERGKVEISLADAKIYLDMYLHITEYPMTVQIIEHSFSIDDIPELHDRLIAGTAKFLNVPVLTNDPDIRHSKYVQTIWEK